MSISSLRKVKCIDTVSRWQCDSYWEWGDHLQLLFTLYFIKVAVHHCRLSVDSVHVIVYCRWCLSKKKISFSDVFHVVDYRNCCASVDLGVLSDWIDDWLYCGRDQADGFHRFLFARWYLIASETLLEAPAISALPDAADGYSAFSVIWRSGHAWHTFFAESLTIFHHSFSDLQLRGRAMNGMYQTHLFFCDSTISAQ